MEDKKTVVNVLRDVFYTFLPNVAGRAIGDALGSIIATLKIQGEVEKLYNTADVLDGYVITTDEVKKAINIPPFKVDIFNVSITIDNKSKEDLNLFSILKSTKTGESYIKFYKVVIKLGLSQKEVLGIEGAGNYSLVYEGGFEYYDDITFKLTDSKGFSIKESDKQSLLIESGKLTKKVKQAGVKQKSFTKAIAKAAEDKKPWNVVVIDIFDALFPLCNIGKTIGKWITDLGQLVPQKIIDIQAKANDWYATTEGANGGYLITVPKLKDAIVVDKPLFKNKTGNLYLKIDKHSSDTENKLGLISIFISPTHSESYINIPNADIRLKINHRDNFGNAATGTTELNYLGSIRYYNNFRFDLKGTKGFLIKDTNFKGNNYEIVITTLILKGGSPSNGFNSLIGKLTGNITLSDSSVIKLNNADITMAESSTEATVTIKVGSLSFLNDDAKLSSDINIEDATFN